jgi:hypothetical protein
VLDGELLVLSCCRVFVLSLVIQIFTIHDTRTSTSSQNEFCDVNRSAEKTEKTKKTAPLGTS